MNKKNKVTVVSCLLPLAALAAGASTTATANTLATFDKPNIPVKYIVKFKEQPESGLSLRSASSVFSGERVAQRSLLDRLSADNIEKFGNEATYSAQLDKNAIEQLQSNPEVEYVEIDPPRYLLSQTLPWGQTFVGATLLDDSNAGNRTVCIIDSGYDLAHNDLSGNQVSGTNDSGTGSWSSPGQHNAHGTHVAGTIAAISNTEGVVGVLPNQNVNLHIVKVFNESGWGYSSGLVKAIDTCVANNANVINMSLGGSNSSRTEEAALKTHYDNGVLLIAAAGNDGNTAHSYPASYDSVMSVAAVDNQKHHADFSQATNQVEIAAPGEAILSTVTLGEGRLADINLAGQSYFDRGVVPHNRLVNINGNYEPSPVPGSVTAELARCDVSSSVYNCGNMSGKVCLTERIGNQLSGTYPEVDAVKACYNAGASAAIVYSNAELAGLQNPFLVDTNSSYDLVSVSVDRALGQELENAVGQTITVNSSINEDYEYYNGTSMATPHVAGVAALVWSYHPQCTASQVRGAMTATAEDIDVAGRDNRTGFGLIDAVSAKEYLDAGCNGPEGNGNGTSFENTQATAIPDNSLSGITSEINVTRAGDASVLTVDLNITHTYIGDLNVKLIAPTGEYVVLHNHSGGSSNNILNSYTVDYTGIESQGTWQLKVYDNARRDTGTLNSWRINFK
ncbi:peptidase S8 [Photobacterium proteolyticum]|uniref:Peptidase S8 n=1 Tax=Photobacterium proteolyticum TaxID=1903952 RepID=A0A1Q9GJ57_9GAMM|nr:S8 family serine peptidase [Photobacterium proteolyticum]OLQ74493.1 peptidase S8 [Photobacterium proteolyticum]